VLPLRPEETIVRISHHHRRKTFAASLALGLAVLGASLGWQVPSAAAGSMDSQASEIVRLINGARSVEGKAPLVIDATLASLARDGAIPCPDDATQSIAGRAKDFATYGYLSHELRDCLTSSFTLSSTLFVSVLQSNFGYGSVGEINLVNSGYGTGKFLYTYGSWSTWTYSTTGHAMAGWKGSSTHWNIIVGGYTRVGCGGWSGGSSYYYDCVFSNGGPAAQLLAPPTQSPFSDAIPTPTPAPRQPAPTPRPRPVATAVPTISPTAVASVIAPSILQFGTYSPEPAASGSTGAPSPTDSLVGVPASGSPPDGVVAVAGLDAGTDVAGPPGQTELPRAALVVGFAAALMSAGGLVLRRWRRGRGRGRGAVAL
jgi:hypothetical protein